MNDKHSGNGNGSGTGTGNGNGRAEIAEDNLWENSPVLLWVTDEAGRLAHFAEMNSDPLATGSLKPLDARLWPIVSRHFRGREAGVMAGQHPVQSVETITGEDGAVHQVLMIQFPFPGEGTRYLVSMAMDITRQVKSQDDLAHLAMIDELTGLYNRRGFLLFAEHELRSARRRRTDSAVFYIDIDGLKQVNDTQGHDKGNAYILETVDILRREFRDSDVIGRLGGDEFAVFAADVKGGRENLKHRLTNRLLQARPGDGPVKLSASVGVVACEPDEGITLASLLAAADQAMYLEKGSRARRTSAWVEGGTDAVARRDE